MPVCVKTEYLGVPDHVELQVLLQLVLVALVEQEILLFTGQGLEGSVAGPEKCDWGVDGVCDDAQQAGVLNHKELVRCAPKPSQEALALVPKGQSKSQPVPSLCPPRGFSGLWLV